MPTSEPSVWTVAVTAATVIMAVAAIVYAKLTASLVRETKLLREAQAEPKISIYLRPRETTPVIVDLIIHNYSQTPAINLAFRIQPDIYYFENEKLSDVDFLKYLSSLQPNETRVLPMSMSRWRPVDSSEKAIPDIVVVEATFQDILGNKKTQKFPLPFKTYSHAQVWVGKTALDKIAASLEKIEGHIQQRRQ